MKTIGSASKKTRVSRPGPALAAARGRALGVGLVALASVLAGLIVARGLLQESVQLQAASIYPEARTLAPFELRDADGRPAAGEPYALHFSDGTVRTGKTDAQGKIKEKDVPPVDHRVTFTRRSAVQRLNS
jgi:hypothetical protein